MACSLPVVTATQKVTINYDKQQLRFNTEGHSAHVSSTRNTLFSNMINAKPWLVNLREAEAKIAALGLSCHETPDVQLFTDNVCDESVRKI
jgi:hypothetical protein